MHALGLFLGFYSISSLFFHFVFSQGSDQNKSKNAASPAAHHPSTTAATTLLGKSAINATMRSQSMNQADHSHHHQQPNSTTKHHQTQQQFQPYTAMPLFPNLASTDPRRLHHPATTTAAAAGFFGLIPPAPGLLPSVAAASSAGWNRRRGSAAIVGSRTFTSFDYALVSGWLIVTA